MTTLIRYISLTIAWLKFKMTTLLVNSVTNGNAPDNLNFAMFCTVKYVVPKNKLKRKKIID